MESAHEGGENMDCHTHYIGSVIDPRTSSLQAPELGQCVKDKETRVDFVDGFWSWGDALNGCRNILFDDGDHVTRGLDVSGDVVAFALDVSGRA